MLYPPRDLVHRCLRLLVLCFLVSATTAVKFVSHYLAFTKNTLVGEHPMKNMITTDDAMIGALVSLGSAEEFRAFYFLTDFAYVITLSH